MQTYFGKVKNASEVTIPKLNAMAYEQVELAGTPLSSFHRRQDGIGRAGEPFFHSAWLRAYMAKQERGRVQPYPLARSREWPRLICKARYAAPRSGGRHDMTARTFVFVVCSLSGRVGKTMTARLLGDYFSPAAAHFRGFDTDAHEPDFAPRFPDASPSPRISTRSRARWL